MEETKIDFVRKLIPVQKIIVKNEESQKYKFLANNNQNEEFSMPWFYNQHFEPKFTIGLTLR